MQQKHLCKAKLSDREPVKKKEKGTRCRAFKKYYRLKRRLRNIKNQPKWQWRMRTKACAILLSGLRTRGAQEYEAQDGPPAIRPGRTGPGRAGRGRYMRGQGNWSVLLVIIPVGFITLVWTGVLLSPSLKFKCWRYGTGAGVFFKLCGHESRCVNARTS